VPVPPNREGLVQIQQPDWGKGKQGTKVTWMGHATFLIETQTIAVSSTEKIEDEQIARNLSNTQQIPSKVDNRGIRILCDPVWSERSSPSQWVGPKRYTPTPCSLQEVCDGGVDIIVISHNHYDHLDTASIREIHQRMGTNVIFLVGLGNRDWFLSTGIPYEQVKEMDWWEGVEVKVGSYGSVKIYCTPSQHNSGRGLLDQNKSLWASWSIIEPGIGGKRIYFAGDTGYRAWNKEAATAEERAALPHCPAFKQIGEELGPFDLALLPIGLCTPRVFMSNVHCNPWDAIQIHLDVNATESIGMHYGTFRGGISQEYEPVTKPPEWWKSAANEANLQWGKNISLMNVGETRVLS